MSTFLARQQRKKGGFAARHGAGPTPPPAPSAFSPAPVRKIAPNLDADSSKKVDRMGMFGPKTKTYPELGIHQTTFYCSTDKTHRIYFLFLIEEDAASEECRLIKIGQFPSVADLAAGEVTKYRATLGDRDYAEFNRAIGLAAHDTFIGSFIYLRRIFERLVEDAHQIAMQDPNWNEDAYHRSRMEEKIKLLNKTYLPDFLVENWQIYSILSKGIHELSEIDCSTHFNLLRHSIEAILNQKMDAEKREKNEVSLRADLQRVWGKLK